MPRLESVAAQRDYSALPGTFVSNSHLADEFNVRFCDYGRSLLTGSKSLRLVAVQVHPAKYRLVGIGNRHSPVMVLTATVFS
jgi:hypothetical protein